MGLNLRAVAAGAILALGLIGCREDGPDVTETGYFKSEERDRVLAYHAPEPLSEAEAQVVFGRITVTPGRVTRGVIYSGPDSRAPGDQLTLAPGLRRALEITVTPPFDDWDWMLMVNPAGDRTIKSR